MKADDSFRIGIVPDTVLELIDIVKSEKAKDLFFVNNQSTVFLNEDLQIDKLKKDITETNDKINSIAWNNTFRRDLTANEGKDEFFKWGITQEELNQYVDYKFDLQLFKNRYFKGEDADQEITLPKFDLITDFLALLEYYNQLNEKLETLQRVNEASVPAPVPTEKKQNGVNMQLDLLSSLFVLKMTAGAKPTPLDLLSKDLRTNVWIYNKNQVTALASIIYQSGMLHKNTKPKTFSKWLEQFCNIIDFPLPTIKQNAVSKEYSELKNTYYYLFP